MAGKSNTLRIAAAIVLALVPTVAVAQDKNTVPLRHSPKAGALLIEVQVHGRPRTFILDTGAQYSLWYPCGLAAKSSVNGKRWPRICAIWKRTSGPALTGY